MNKIVVKFGGSNLKSTSDIKKIIEIVRNYNQPLIIVVSAFYGVTDILNSILNQISENKKIDFDLHIDEIKAKKISVIKEYIKNEKNRNKAFKIIDYKIHLLRTLCNDFKNATDLAELKDEILSYGERLSAFTISEVLKDNEINTEIALPENIGLLTNSRFLNGSVLLKKSSEKLKKYFINGITYVVPGFYGVSNSGKTVLLGRGGSDYSAAAISHCINAESLDLWKDVAGYLSVDPKIVESGKKIDKLTYLEAAELSYFGAKIIHPRTIQALISKNIKINVFDINSKKDNKKGTTINGVGYKSDKIIKSITYENNFSLLKLKGTGVGIRKGILANVTTAFDKANINIRSVITSQIEIDFLLSNSDLHSAQNIVKNLNNNNFTIEIDNNISLIAAVGNGITESHGISAKIFSALAKKEINVKNIVFGASNVAIYVIIDKYNLEPAITEIHNQIFN